MKKRMLYLAGILILLIFTYVGINSYKVSLINKQQNQNATMLIHALNTADIEKIEVDNSLETFVLYRGSDDEWEIRGYESLPYQTGMISSYIEIINNVSAERIIEENSVDLGKYGLDKPVKINYIFKNGKSYIFLVGNQTPDKKAYYAKKQDESTVYLINEGRGDTFKQTYKDLFVKEFLKEINISDEDTVTSFLFAGKDRQKPIIIQQIPKDDKNLTISNYRMTSPGQYDVSISIIQKIMNELTGVMRGEVVKVFPDKLELAQYGLDVPMYSVAVTTTEGSSILNIGGLDDKGKRYVMRDGVDILFSVDDEKINWALSNEYDFISSIPFVRALSTISYIKVDSQTNHFEFYLSENSTKITLNGKPIDSNTFIPFYTALSKITTVGRANEQDMTKIKNDKAALTIEIKYNNGMDNDLLAFKKLDDWLYLFKINNSGELSVTSKTIDEIQTLLASLN